MKSIVLNPERIISSSVTLGALINSLVTCAQGRGPMETIARVAGLTYIPMGIFEQGKNLDHQARVKLKNWAAELPHVNEGFSATTLLHGHSGVWENETVFSIWRGIKIDLPDYAFFKGRMILNIPSAGTAGIGCVYGELKVRIDRCYAEFAVTDVILSARIKQDGRILLRSAMQSRHRVRMDGAPPQEDGFEVDLRGAREYDSILSSAADEAAVLRGDYKSELGGRPFSFATERFWR